MTVIEPCIAIQTVPRPSNGCNIGTFVNLLLGLLEIHEEPAGELGVSTWGMAKGIARAERP